MENFLKAQQQNAAHPDNPNFKYNNDITYKQNPLVKYDKQLKENTVIPITDHRQNLMLNFQNMSLSFDNKNLQIPKNHREYDTESVASSTHFTVVNGFGTPTRFKESRKLCSPYNQITVLIFSMTLFFLVAIIVLIYMMESESIFEL